MSRGTSVDMQGMLPSETLSLNLDLNHLLVSRNSGNILTSTSARELSGFFYGLPQVKPFQVI